MAARNHLINYVTNYTSNTGDIQSVFPESIWNEFDKTFQKIWYAKSVPYVCDNASLPKTNIYENNGELILEASIPFADKDEVKVTIDPMTNGIKIEVDAHQDTNENSVYYLKEISRTSFKRSFAIDKRFNVKKAKAEFEDGILTVWVPVSKDAEKIVLDL